MNNPATGSGAPTEGWTDVGDLRLRFLDWGGDGPAIMALHGLASSAHWSGAMTRYWSRSWPATRSYQWAEEASPWWEEFPDASVSRFPRAGAGG